MTRIESLVVLVDQLDQFLAVDQPQVVLALGEGRGLGRERAEGYEQAVLLAADFAIQG